MIQNYPFKLSDGRSNNEKELNAAKNKYHVLLLRPPATKHTTVNQAHHSPTHRSKCCRSPGRTASMRRFLRAGQGVTGPFDSGPVQTGRVGGSANSMQFAVPRLSAVELLQVLLLRGKHEAAARKGGPGPTTKGSNEGQKGPRTKKSIPLRPLSRAASRIYTCKSHCTQNISFLQ